MGWLASLALEDEVKQELGLPQAVCEYEKFFLMNYWDYLRGM